MNQLTETQWAYIAGFLDADGSIFAQVTRREDYQFKFGLRFTVAFIQKTSRNYFLIQLQKELGIGSFRNRKDGISELDIVGWASVEPFLKKVSPYLRIKKKQASLLLKMIEQLPLTRKSPLRFLEACGMAEQVSMLNNSKNREFTAELVRKVFLELKLL